MGRTRKLKENCRELVGQRRQVPKNPVEKAARQAFERNRFAALLFDGWEGLGNRFLPQAAMARCKDG
jgi:hypothetical protein